MIKVMAKNYTEFLFIPLPKKAADPWVVNNGTENVRLNYYIPDKTFGDEKNTMSAAVDLEAFKRFELIACTDTITEEQALTIVDRLHFVTDRPYKNYQEKSSIRHWKALDSFVSLMIANKLLGKYAVLKQV